MAGDFIQFQKSYQQMAAHHAQTQAEEFAVEEFKRFHSIAGTILASFPNVATNIDQRIISHILLRSLLESYFWILYIFDNKATIAARFAEYMGGFKREYGKLYADPGLPPNHQAQMAPAVAGWAQIQRPKDINSVLVAVRNVHGNRLDYLYFLYRITSFDTHGKCLKSLFDVAFGVTTNFPFLKIDTAIDLIANEYLAVWQNM